VFDHASSEGPRAREVAEAMGTTHREIVVDASHVAADFTSVLAHLDQPTIDGVNGFYVSRAVAATGIKAVLSGAGGDELFGGYPSFSRLPRAIRAKRIAGPLWPVAAAAGRAVLPRRLQLRWRHFAQSNGNLIEAYRVQRAFLLPEELAAIAGPALQDQRVRADASVELDRAEHTRLDPAGQERPAASVARMESRFYLTAQLLRDLDVMSMAHGLEVRVPFVDHVLLDEVWPELGRHTSLLADKRVLRNMLTPPFPEAIAQRPKQGFTLPFAQWMRGDLEPVVRDGLRALSRSGWIAADAPDRVWRAWQDGHLHWSRPWGLGLLGTFLSV